MGNRKLLDESRINQRMFHLMESGFFGKKLLKEDESPYDDNDLDSMSNLILSWDKVNIDIVFTMLEAYPLVLEEFFKRSEFEELEPFLRENTLLKNVVRRYESLIKKKGVGILGKLEESDLENPNKYEDEINTIIELYYDLEDAYNYDDDFDYKQGQSELFSKLKDNIVYKMWFNYKNAMERNRPDSALSLDRFANYLNSGTLLLFENNESYIIGKYSNGFFKPSHFAPKSIREGIEIIKELIKYDNIVFTVTDDLKDMLDKLGAYSNDNLVISMIFRDMLVKKHVVLTNPYIMAQVLNGLMNNEYKDISDFENITYEDLK